MQLYTFSKLSTEYTEKHLKMSERYQCLEYVKKERMQTSNEKDLLKSANTVAKNGLKQAVASNTMHFYNSSSL